MAALDLKNFLLGLEELREKTSVVMVGIENEEDSHLTPEERALLVPWANKYEKFHIVANVLAQHIQELIDLGYPELPTLDIPTALKDKLEKQNAATQIAFDLLHAVNPAVSGSFGFSDPKDKP